MSARTSFARASGDMTLPADRSEGAWNYPRLRAVILVVELSAPPSRGLHQKCGVVVWFGEVCPGCVTYHTRNGESGAAGSTKRDF